MKNLELKVYIPDRSDFSLECSILNQNEIRNIGDLIQIDKYYSIGKSRIKTRVINDKDFQLIFYKRENNKNSKLSHYKIFEFNFISFKIVSFLLSTFLRQKTVVKKKRNLWIHKNTRIHLDNVEGLGNFIELETVINDFNTKEYQKEHTDMICRLNLNNFIKIADSYSDLMLRESLQSISFGKTIPSPYYKELSVDC